MNSDFPGSQKPDFPLGVSVIQEDWPPLALGRTVAQARQPACSSISHTGMDLGWPNWSKTWPRGFCWEGGLFSSFLGPRRKSLALRAMWRLTLFQQDVKNSPYKEHMYISCFTSVVSAYCHDWFNLTLISWSALSHSGVIWNPCSPCCPLILLPSQLPYRVVWWFSRRPLRNYEVSFLKLQVN